MTAPAIIPAKPRINLRDQAKQQTRERVLEAARKLFKQSSYKDVTIRAVAKSAGMSTGAIFASVKDKSDLWREAMGTEPPLDTIDNPVIRAAPAMQKALRNLITARARHENSVTDYPVLDAAWAEAELALAASEPALETEERRAA